MTSALPTLARLLLLPLLLAPFPAPATPETPAMIETPQALTLDVETRDGMLEVRLTGLSPQAQAVSYTLEVKGRSTSRHRGSTRLAPGVAAVLSTMRAAADEDWCVTLHAEEEGRAPYEITRGTCPAG